VVAFDLCIPHVSLSFFSGGVVAFDLRIPHASLSFFSGGVVAFDLRTRRLKWSQHLDLSTDTTTYRAYAYAPPTLADINRWAALCVAF
jgi:outer membrane protein assembly factor BamB